VARRAGIKLAPKPIAKRMAVPPTTTPMAISTATSPKISQSGEFAALWARGVLEIPFAIVVVEDGGIIEEVRFCQVKMTIEVVVADADSHARLLHTIFTNGDSAEQTFFAESSIMIVHEQ
jgi:hypothetical protein